MRGSVYVQVFHCKHKTASLNVSNVRTPSWLVAQVTSSSSPDPLRRSLRTLSSLTGVLHLGGRSQLDWNQEEDPGTMFYK